MSRTSTKFPKGTRHVHPLHRGPANRIARLSTHGWVVAVVLICCAQVLFLPACSAQQRIQGFPTGDVVVFDNSREQFWTPFDAGFFGYSELTVSLRDAGFVVTESNIPVTYSLAFEPRGSVLVMGPAVGQRYTTKEINAIVEYVKNGGGLLILGEEAAPGTDNFQNTLASMFGIRFRNVTVVDTANSIRGTAGQWILAGSDFFGVGSVSLARSVQLITTGSAVSVLSTGKTSTPAQAIVGAAVKFGKGRVACVGDSQFLTNGGKKELGIECAQNKEFALALFSWLAGKERRPTSRIVPQYTLVTADYIVLKVKVEGTTDLAAHIQGGTIEPDTVRDASGELTFAISVKESGFVEFVGDDGSRKTVVFLKPPSGGIGAYLLFDTRCYGPDMAAPVNGLLDFAVLLRDKGFWVWAIEEGVVDVSSLYAVVVVNPLRNDPLLYAGELKNQRLRWLLIGDPTSSIGVHNEVGEWFREGQFPDREAPIAALARAFGITFLPFVIYEPIPSRTAGRHPTFPILNLGNEKCYAFKCGIVEAENARPILLASDSAWGLEGGMGVRSGENLAKPGKYDYKKGAAVPPVAAILSRNAMALADLHILSSQHLLNRGNWTFASDLANWLAGQEFREYESEP
ncbi:MAG: hypothetical protein NTX17_08085 [Candidatus Eisenbacteria bacterium]|nr:hypothetical protein [Candidatus Eisenbacteria bacterium]